MIMIHTTSPRPQGKGRLAIALLASLVVACGGGNGEEEWQPVDTTQPVALVDGNAVAVTGLVVASAAGGGELGRGLLDLVFDVFQGAQASGAITWSQVPANAPCPQGGAVAVTIRDGDGDGVLSVGDGLVLDFAACLDDGARFDGNADIGLLALTGNPASDPAWNALWRLNVNGLFVVDGPSVVEAIGTLDLAQDRHASGIEVLGVTTEVGTGSATSSSFLQFQEDDGEFTSLTQFAASLEVRPDGSYVFDGSGTLRSSFIAGFVGFETPQPLAGQDFGTGDPSGGELRVAGASGSAVRLRAIDAVRVELDVDDEGDGFGAGDLTIVTSWSALADAANAL